MLIRIHSTQALGRIIRAVRKEQGLRQDDTAGSVGVSENFLGKLERGADSVRLGKVLQVLDELGIELLVDVTESAGQLVAGSDASRERGRRAGKA